MRNKAQFPLHCLGLFIQMSSLIACGSWVGNGQKENETEKTGEPGEVIADDRKLLAGDVIYHKLILSANANISASYIPTGTALRLEDDAAQSFEISVIDPNGQEISYNRQGGEVLTVETTAPVAGDYVIAIKNNSEGEITIDEPSIEGADEDKGVTKALAEGEATHGQVSLKAAVVLARQCKSYTAGGSSTVTRTAPDGEAFVQPFVFVGKVDLTNRKVELVTDVQLKISGGSSEMKLNRLDDFELSVFRENGSLSKAEHIAYTRSFYQGYFGAAGEFYTVETFRFGGDCSKMPTFVINSNPGASELKLHVQSDSLGLNESFDLRPTVPTAFSLYESEDKEIDNWDPCRYDNFTAEPQNANTPTLPCRELDPLNPPYVTLDYLLPSEQFPAQYTKSSDPTRILYYGHSLSREFKKAIIDQQAELRAGTQTKITLSRCMNNGGINSVAITKEPSYLPLNEFNVSAGDLIQLSRKTGSYTALTEYFQGNADVSGTVSYPVCIPNSTTQESCPDYKVLTVESQNCHVKADSGVFVTSFQDSFIYPEYYELSGSLKP